MTTLIKYLSIPLNSLLHICYGLAGNYILAILFFTLLTKIILLPVSLWLHRNGIRMVELMPELNRLKIKHFGDKEAIAEETQKLYKQRKYHPLASTLPMVIQVVLLMGVIEAVKNLLAGQESMLSLYPSQTGGITLLFPLLAGAASLLLGLAQNRFNPLQHEQSKAEQWMTNGLSIGISLVLGMFVSIGVCIYWISGNLFSILNQLVCNAIIPPAKYIDYSALEESQKELESMSSLGNQISKEDKKREKEDYKRFFSVANKHLVFYSESSGFYKYYQGVIEELLRCSNVTIHYVTSDPKDQIFELAKLQPKIRPYYIGEKRLITLFMKMDADMVVMTMPDLENFHIKRSYVRKDIEYVYMCHGIGSMNMLLRHKALFHYDTIFSVGEHQTKEFEAEQRVYHLPVRTIVPYGYGLLDETMEAYAKMPRMEKDKPQILIAPSWQTDNIMDTCIDELLEELLKCDYKIIIRPHPEYCKRFPQKIQSFRAKYAEKWMEDFVLQTDFSSNETVFTSDLLITDWSTICYEFAFTTKKPVLFLNTPMKVMNPEYEELGIVPLEIECRTELGVALELDQVSKAKETVEELFRDPEHYRKKIENLLQRSVYHLGTSDQVGASYLLHRMLERQTAKVEIGK